MNNEVIEKISQVIKLIQEGTQLIETLSSNLKPELLEFIKSECSEIQTCCFLLDQILLESQVEVN